MRKVLPLVAVVWGAGIIVYGVSKSSASGSGSYAAGSMVAVVFGVALFAGGIRWLTKRSATSY